MLMPNDLRGHSIIIRHAVPVSIQQLHHNKVEAVGGDNVALPAGAYAVLLLFPSIHIL